MGPHALTQLSVEMVPTPATRSSIYFFDPFGQFCKVHLWVRQIDPATNKKVELFQVLPDSDKYFPLDNFFQKFF